MEDIIIHASDAGKYYQMYSKPWEKWADLFLPGRRGFRFWALRNISLSISSGETVGLIGLNGSGKSTLSNLIAGVARPSAGTLRVTGNAAMIAVSAGLNASLTGMENIEMKGLLIGMSRKQIQRLKPEIIEFSGIGHFIDQPVKTYSSGMRARLAFSIAIHIDPDILVVDEGLTVGDSTFTDRCLAYVEQFQEKGKSLVMVSHSVAQIQQFCKRLIWLDNGEIRMDGDRDAVMKEYAGYLKWYKTLTNSEKAAYASKQYQARCQISS